MYTITPVTTRINPRPPKTNTNGFVPPPLLPPVPCVGVGVGAIVGVGEGVGDGVGEGVGEGVGVGVADGVGVLPELLPNNPPQPDNRTISRKALPLRISR